MKHWGIYAFGTWRDWLTWKHNRNKNSSYLWPCFCHCFLQDVGIPRFREWGQTGTKREGVCHTVDTSLCGKHQIYSHLGHQKHQSTLSDSRAIPLQLDQWCPQQQELNIVLTAKAGCHMHSSHPEASSQPKAQVPYFTIPPSVAGHVTILYLL